jgi:hypothetical protein
MNHSSSLKHGCSHLDSSNVMGRELGQGMTEFLVVLIGFLVPLMLIMPVLAQMISLRQQTEIATRYGAWERTVWNTSAPQVDPDDASETAFAPTSVKSDNQIALEVDRRVLVSGATQIYTTQINESLTLQPFELVNNPTVGYSSMMKLRGYDGIIPEYANQASTETAATGLSAYTSSLLAGIGAHTQFDLNSLGLVSSNVSVDLVSFDWLGADFNLAPLSYKRSNVLFTDSWNPAGRNHAAYLAQGLMPQQAYRQGTSAGDSLCTGLAYMAQIPSSKEVECWNEAAGTGYLNFGYVDIDPVPSYRLSTY